jgi:hypothetical protein
MGKTSYTMWMQSRHDKDIEVTILPAEVHEQVLVDILIGLQRTVPCLRRSGTSDPRFQGLSQSHQWKPGHLQELVTMIMALYSSLVSC